MSNEGYFLSNKYNQGVVQIADNLFTISQAVGVVEPFTDIIEVQLDPLTHEKKLYLIRR